MARFLCTVRLAKIGFAVLWFVGRCQGASMESIASGSKLKEFVGKHVKLQGRPLDTKAGAALGLEDHALVYLDGMGGWPNKTADYGEIIVEGQLKWDHDKWILAQPDWYLRNSKRNVAGFGAVYQAPKDAKLVPIAVIREHVIPGKTTRRNAQDFLQKLRQEGYWIEPLPNPNALQIQFSVKEGYVVDIAADWAPESKVTSIEEHR